MNYILIFLLSEHNISTVIYNSLVVYNSRVLLRNILLHGTANCRSVDDAAKTEKKNCRNLRTADVDFTARPSALTDILLL